MDNLTRNQTMVFLYIKEYINKNGISPTINEICKEFFIEKGTVSYYLKALREAGYIEMLKPGNYKVLV